MRVVRPLGGRREKGRQDPQAELFQSPRLGFDQRRVCIPEVVREKPRPDRRLLVACAERARAVLRGGGGGAAMAFFSSYGDFTTVRLAQTHALSPAPRRLRNGS